MKKLLILLLIIITNSSYAQTDWERFTFLKNSLELNLPYNPIKYNINLNQDFKNKLEDYDFYKLKNKFDYVNCVFGYYIFKKDIEIELSTAVAGGIRNINKLEGIKDFREETKYFKITGKESFLISVDFIDSKGKKHKMQNIGIKIDNQTLFTLNFINMPNEIINAIIDSIKYK